ncbi:Fur-regulated basic protein FbpA [Niallia taxi]|uniref:Fur-regulated basic protein FbpA n=1 Tax=Niallia taxi TaxID=2499688 RepID=UPI002934B7A8|nr:Fur-regulated basic protein FbpA [Niallia taxi]WOD61961.1 Fur-regulated basic protein FbpA [Niallia taxi]
MSRILKELVDRRKHYIIDSLIAAKHYKKGEQHLYELTLTDLEIEFARLKNIKE